MNSFTIQAPMFSNCPYSVWNIQVKLQHYLVAEYFLEFLVPCKDVVAIQKLKINGNANLGMPYVSQRYKIINII